MEIEYINAKDHKLPPVLVSHTGKRLKRLREQMSLKQAIDICILEALKAIEFHLSPEEKKYLYKPKPRAQA